MFNQVHQVWNDPQNGSFRLVLDESAFKITPQNALAAARLRNETQRVLKGAAAGHYIKPFDHMVDPTPGCSCQQPQPERYEFKPLPVQPDYSQQIQDAGVNTLLDTAEGYINKIAYTQRVHALSAGVYQGYIDLVRFNLESAAKFQLTQEQ